METPTSKWPKEREPESMLPLSAAVFAILLVLSEKQKHGYGIIKETALPEGGGVSMGPGTLYGSLDRMMRAGLIEETGTTDDERRRYYRLTRFGRRVLNAELLRLDRAIRSIRSKCKFGVAHS
jgi:DNA-binding PadR family transcriptional regulator